MDIALFESLYAQAGITRPYIQDPFKPGLQVTLYFDYGSYFTVAEFKQRCPSARPAAIGWLGNWTWHINKDGHSHFAA